MSHTVLPASLGCRGLPGSSGQLLTTAPHNLVPHRLTFEIAASHQHPTTCAWLGSGAGQRAGLARAPGGREAAVPAVSASARQTQPAQGCLFWLSATRGWHYIKPCGAWQVLAGGDQGAGDATKGWAPPKPPQAPHSRGCS